MSEDKLIERLPGTLKRIAEECGLDAALKIAKLFGGTHPFIPKLDAFYREGRNQRIRVQYEAGGVTAAQLALQHGLTERQIFTILGEEPETPPPSLPLI